ncbi:MAG: hypothetical protein LCH78_18155 [Proteobacteria bacterium]|nr:hypothetical protein [Pseudomonadota bacterium]
MVEAIMTMTSDQVFAIATVMVVIALVLSIGAALFDFREHGDTLGVSALLALILQISMIVRAHPSDPHGYGTMIVFPLVDLAALCVVSYLFATRPRVWKAVVAFAFLAQLVAHFGFWSALNSGKDSYSVYVLIGNLLAGLQKLALGIAGAHGLAIGLSAWLSRHRYAGVRAVLREPHQ